MQDGGEDKWGERALKKVQFHVRSSFIQAATGLGALISRAQCGGESNVQGGGGESKGGARARVRRFGRRVTRRREKRAESVGGRSAGARSERGREKEGARRGGRREGRGGGVPSSGWRRRHHRRPPTLLSHHGTATRWDVTQTSPDPAVSDNLPRPADKQEVNLTSAEEIGGSDGRDTPAKRNLAGRAGGWRGSKPTNQTNWSSPRNRHTMGCHTDLARPGSVRQPASGHENQPGKTGWADRTWIGRNGAPYSEEQGKMEAHGTDQT